MTAPPADATDPLDGDTAIGRKGCAGNELGEPLSATQPQAPTGSAHRVIASAPAKVNLILRVGTVDAQGYHALATVFEALSLREFVTAELVADVARGDSLPSVRTVVYEVGVDGVPQFSPETTAELADLDGPRHLAVRAAAVLGADSRIALTVYKTVPVAGGMAGGSADAAASLVAVNELLGRGLSPDQLQEIGRGLGADVPACLVGGIALGTGRGDRMRVLREGANESDADSNWWVLVTADFGLSTPAVFNRFDAMVEVGAGRSVSKPAHPGRSDLVRSDCGERAGPQGDEAGQNEAADSGGDESDAARGMAPQVAPAELAALGGTLQVGDLAGLLVNDLQAAALVMRPELAGVGEKLAELSALGWLVSGSGPTLAALAASRADAERIAAAVRTADLPGVRDAWVAYGPTSGAQLEPELPAWTTN